MSLPWFRLYTEFASDPVIQSLAFEDQRHYVVILCFKCNGTLDRDMDPNNREHVIIRGLGLDPMAGQEAKRRLMELELIDEDWQPRGWDKRQFKSDTSTPRVRKYRKNKDNGKGNVSETLRNRSSNGPRTDQNRSDQNREGARARKARSSPPRFVKPTIPEIREYCEQIGSPIDPSRFWNHYETVGWKVGKNPMKDWKAAVRSWTSREEK